MNCSITYIWHDCFVVELNDCILIFDYWADPDGRIFDFITHDKPVYIFVSHHHKDHFCKEIFSWSSQLNNKISYIISSDTARFIKHLLSPRSTYKGKLRIDPERVKIMSEGDYFSDDLISVNAYGSTDIGCSYLISHSSKLIFHAGDLNAWILEEKTPSEKTQEISNFKSILSHIAKTSETIDLAMFPIDSRIGSDYTMGADIFLNRFDIRHLIPMHFANCDQSLRQKRIDDVIAYKNTISLLNPNTEFHALTNPYTGIEL